MKELEPLRLLPWFVVLTSLWLASSAYVLLNRAVYDRRRRRVRRAWEWLVDVGRNTSPEERARWLERRLSGLPRNVLEQVPADPASPQWVAEAFSAHLVKRWGLETWLRRASSHRGEYGKWKRVTALHVLFHVAYHDIVSLLERALLDRDEDVVGAGVVLLRGLGTYRAAELLVDALARELYPPSRIATQLDGYPIPIAEPLLPLLESSSPSARFWATTLLSRYPDAPGLDQKLAALAEDPEPLVRKAAVETLGLVGGKAAAPTAMKLLEDPVWYVKAHAARALGDLNRRDLAGRVAPLLGDRVWWVRTAVKESLQSMGEEVWEEVVPFLDHPDRFARNGAAEVLQNLGWLDRLLEEVARGDREPGKLELLQKISAAGGARLVDSLAWRAADRPALAEAMETLGFEPAGGR